MAERLARSLAVVIAASTPAPRSGNPSHWNDHLLRSVGVCALHRAEAEAIPAGREQGYPTNIDFNAVPGRLTNHLPTLRNDIPNPSAQRLFSGRVSRINRGLNIRGLAGRMYRGNTAGAG